MRSIYQVAALTGILAVTSSQFAGSTAAAAQPAAGDTRAVVVRYDDLDLTRDAGRRVLQARLVNAAERACGSYDPHNIRARQSWKDCVSDALAAAVEGFSGAEMAALQASNAE